MTSLDTALTLPSLSSHELFTPAPSHTSLQYPDVPDVFVIPPEEELHVTPAFCYFDAAMESRKNLSFVPDMDALDVALGFTQQTDNRAPMFHRAFGNESQDTVVMPRRGSVQTQDVPTEVRSKRVVDEDVVEVVKVRKTEGASNPPAEKGYALKKSKTFRARASQAFRSIKNVGKGSGTAAHGNHRKPFPETWSSTSDRENQAQGFAEHGVMPRTATTPTMGHRKSMQLSQIFTTRSRSPVPDVPISPTSPTSSDWEALSRPSLTVEEGMNPQLPAIPEAQEQPTLSKRRSFVRRISVLDLHRLFSPTTPTAPKLPSPVSQEQTDLPASASQTSQASRTSSKRDSMPILHSSSSGLSDVFSSSSPSSGTQRAHSFDASATQSTLRSSPSTEVDGGDVAYPGDASLELQLDSLHFDSLHFDPDEF